MCLSTLEDRLGITEVRRPKVHHQSHGVLTVEPAENLAAGTGSYTVTSGIKGWTDEAKDYDPQNPQYSHFTQVVWKGTKQLGCAFVDCPAGSIFPSQYGVRNVPPVVVW